MEAGAEKTDVGSSPRMRGALTTAREVLITDGIIPADAGSTAILSRTHAGWRDHPRGCGEHAMKGGRVTFSQGSSPRMRGAPEQHE